MGAGDSPSITLVISKLPQLDMNSFDYRLILLECKQIFRKSNSRSYQLYKEEAFWTLPSQILTMKTLEMLLNLLNLPLYKIRI